MLADAGYGVDTAFRTALTKMEMTYVMGVQSAVTVWKPGEEPQPAPAGRSNTGRPRKLLQRDSQHRPVSVKELAVSVPAKAWKMVTWREGVKQRLRSRFAALRVRPAHRDYWRSEPYPEEWVLIEWPKGEKEPTNTGYPHCPRRPGSSNWCAWPSTAGSSSGTIRNSSRSSVWATTKGAVGAAFTITPPYASRPMGSWWPNGIVFSPQRAPAILDYQLPKGRRTSGHVVRRVRPERHNPRSITTLRMVLAHYLIGRIAHCPFCGSRSG